MRGTLITLLIVAIIVVVGGTYYLTKNNFYQPAVPQTGANNLIHVTSPKPGEKITSPLIVRGEARGSWYFEASFPVKILDSNGQVIASGPAQAQGDWMTTEFVPFEITLSFTKPTSTALTAQVGTLRLERDNPSGLPANDAYIYIPIRF